MGIGLTVSFAVPLAKHGLSRTMSTRTRRANTPITADIEATPPHTPLGVAKMPLAVLSRIAVDYEVRHHEAMMQH